MGCTHTCMPRVWWLWVILFFVQLLINVNTVVPSRAQRPIVLRCCRGECWLACSTLPSVLESPSFFLRHSRVYELAARLRAPARHYYHHYFEGRPARALLQFNTASTWIRPPFSNQSRSVSLSRRLSLLIFLALFLSCLAWRVSVHSDKPDEYKTSSTLASITTHAHVHWYEE